MHVCSLSSEATEKSLSFSGLILFHDTIWEIPVLTSSYPWPTSTSNRSLLILGPLPLPIACVVVGLSITMLFPPILPRIGRLKTQPKLIRSSFLETGTVMQKVCGWKVAEEDLFYWLCLKESLHEFLVGELNLLQSFLRSKFQICRIWPAFIQGFSYCLSWTVIIL